MMPDDQGMSEEWIVRVHGKEYGPANLDTLREWKAEGRLLPANDARRVNVDLWATAGEIPELFSVTPSVEAATQLTEPPVQVSRRSFNQILAETFQIYRKGFFQFLGLVLLVLLPSICSQLITAFVQPLLILQVWMFGRFFVNVLFWQQFTVLENAGFIDALRDSRNLARSGRDLPWFQRPLWRGTLIASLWFAFVLAVRLGPEWTTLQNYIVKFVTTQDPQTLLQQLSEAQQARGFDL